MGEQPVHTGIIKKAAALWKREGTRRLLTLFWNRFYLLRKDISGPVAVETAPGVRIRLTEEDDLAGLAELMYISQEELRDILAQGNKCMLAYVDNHLAGYSWIYYHSYRISDVCYTVIAQQGEAYVGPDYVHPDFRGRRIHSSLLQAVFSLLNQEGYKVALGSVNIRNTASIKGLVRVSYRAYQRVDYIKTAIFKRVLEVSLPRDFEMRMR